MARAMAPVNCRLKATKCAASATAVYANGSGAWVKSARNLDGRSPSTASHDNCHRMGTTGGLVRGPGNGPRFRCPSLDRSGSIRKIDRPNRRLPLDESPSPTGCDRSEMPKRGFPGFSAACERERSLNSRTLGNGERNRLIPIASTRGARDALAASARKYRNCFRLARGRCLTI